jgi:excisionase family DNA binding protein
MGEDRSGDGDPHLPEMSAARDDERLLLTLEEAARRLSVGRTTLYELAAQGRLQTVTIGRCRRVPVSALESFVNRLMSERVAEPIEVEQVEHAKGRPSPTHPRPTMKRILRRSRT